MNNKILKIAWQLAVPAAYTVVNATFWPYALYQDLNLVEFTAFVITCGVATLGLWVLTHWPISLKSLIRLGAVLTILAALQWGTYYFILSVPTGWGSLTY